jgi:hypothetical protein
MKRSGAPPVPNERDKIVSAANLVYGKRWQSALAHSSGLSQALLSMIASKDRARALTPEAKTAIVNAIRADAEFRSQQNARAIALVAGIE